MIKVFPKRLAEAERYADAIRKLSYSVNHFKQIKLPTIFDDINLSNEFLSVEKAVTECYKYIENIDTSKVIVGHFYKELWKGSSNVWNHNTVYVYEIIDIDYENNKLMVKKYHMNQYGVFNDDGTNSEPYVISLKYFAAKTNKGTITEISEEEYTEIVNASKLFYDLYKKSGGIKYEEYIQD